MYEHFTNLFFKPLTARIYLPLCTLTARAILGADVPIIEDLVNLDKLVGKTFDVMAFPLKIDGLEASPARVLAKLH